MYSELFKKQNVSLVGRGFRTVRGERVGTGVVVGVTKKLPLGELRSNDVVPLFVDKIPTDVIEVGEIKALAYISRERPIQPGFSIGHFNITAGTLGAIVTDLYTDEKVILSNCHVLADSGNGTMGDAILQPGAYDGGKNPQDKVGELLCFVPIEFGGAAPPTCPVAKGVEGVLNFLASLFGSSHRLEAKKLYSQQSHNLVDAAIASIDEGIGFHELIKDIGQIEGTAEVGLGSTVQKTGRTTEHTFGEIILVDATVQVSYGELGTAVFEDQLVAGPMSAGGDSGSLGVTMDNLAFGLLFAGSEQITIYNRFANVLGALGLAI